MEIRRASGDPRGGWDEEAVVTRWKEELVGDGGADVRLSVDAGRFLCDFIYYESLSVRWKETNAGVVDADGRSREGKVCFLHVPGDTDPASLVRGTRVAEAAIRSIVGSWEDGMRRNGYGKRRTAALHPDSIRAGVDLRLSWEG